MSYAEKRDGKLTGRWCGAATVQVDGKSERLRHFFETKKEADGYEVFVKLMGYEPPGLGTSDTSGRTFATVAAECKAAGGPRGAWKAERDKSVLQRLDHAVTILGAYDILQVKTKQLEDLVEDLQKRPVGGRKLTNSTINRYLHAASAVLTYACDRDYIPKMPKVPLLKEVRKKRGILRSFSQEDAILNAMRAAGHEKDAFCVKVLVTSGMRKSELFKLRPDQIENGYVHFEEDQTKNDEARSVYIGEDLARELKALVAANALPNKDQLLRKFKKAVADCGYAPNLVIHSLRHTRNTRLRQSGVDIQIRMKMLGHKTVSTNLLYGEVDSVDELEAAKKVEEARGSSAEPGSVLPFPVRVSG